MNDDLLVKFLLNETTEKENLQVEQWVAASPANKKHLADLELIWTTSKNLALQNAVDEDEAWNKFKLRVEQSKARPEAEVKSLWRNSLWRNIAAAVLLVAGGWFFYTQILAPETTLIANNEVRTEILPDGSEVTLNKNSSLSYSFPLTARKRMVKLDKGEVFFNVSPDKSKPFVIQALGVTIEVVGTSFNVDHSATATEIIVETGIVRVSEGKSVVTLHKGQKVTTSGIGQLSPQPVTDQLYNYYRTGRFTATNTPLSRIVEMLNKTYDVKIVIANPALGDQTLTTTFEVGSLDQNLKIIAETLNLKVEQSGGNILLK